MVAFVVAVCSSRSLIASVVAVQLYRLPFEESVCVALYTGYRVAHHPPSLPPYHTGVKRFLKGCS